MNIPLFFSVCLDGLVLGLIYALAGMGLSLIFGLMGILNFAHANFIVIAVYAAIVVFSFLPNSIVAVIGGLAILTVITLVIYHTLITPVFKFGADAAMMNTFALSYFLEVTVLLLFGPYYRKAPAIIPDISITLFGGIMYSSYRITIAVVSAAVLIALFVFIRRSMFGKALRAVMQDMIAASLVGINLRRVMMWGFVIAILLAGIAGVLIAPMYLVYPRFADRLLPISFAVTIVGGLGNIEGALIAGIVIGLAESLGGVYISSAYKDAIIFLTLIAVLLIRPRGILGRK